MACSATLRQISSRTFIRSKGIQQHDRMVLEWSNSSYIKDWSWHLYLVNRPSEVDQFDPWMCIDRDEMLTVELGTIVGSPCAIGAADGNRNFDPPAIIQKEKFQFQFLLLDTNKWIEVHWSPFHHFAILWFSFSFYHSFYQVKSTGRSSGCALVKIESRPPNQWITSDVSHFHFIKRNENVHC